MASRSSKPWSRFQDTQREEGGKFSNDPRASRPQRQCSILSHTLRSLLESLLRRVRDPSSSESIRGQPIHIL